MQIGIFDIFLALVSMGPILVSIDATFSINQYPGSIRMVNIRGWTTVAPNPTDCS